MVHRVVGRFKSSFRVQSARRLGPRRLERALVQRRRVRLERLRRRDPLGDRPLLLPLLLLNSKALNAPVKVLFDLLGVLGDLGVPEVEVEALELLGVSPSL